MVLGGGIGVGDDVRIGNGVRDVKFGIIIVNGYGNVGVEDCITLAYEVITMDLIVLCE